MIRHLPYQRSQRVAEVLKKELGEIFLRHIEAPAGKLVTINTLDLSKKLDSVKVFISILPSSIEDQKFIDVLNKRKPWIAQFLLKKMKIRAIPKMTFILDKSLERASAIEKNLLE